LSARGVEYESINVLEDAAGLRRLAEFGMRSLPVVARGDDYVFGVDLSKVARLVGLVSDDASMLSVDVLVDRYRHVLAAAIRFAGQIPAQHLHDKLPNRDRSYLTLANHLVQISLDFVDIANGADFTGRRAASLPEVDSEIFELVTVVEGSRHALAQWLQQSDAAQLQRIVVTYFGDQTLHQALERCVWHSAQHARQLMMVLDLLGVDVHDPLLPEDFAGLPMPEQVWDS
jgi:hypothetical protein